MKNYVAPEVDLVEKFETEIMEDFVDKGSEVDIEVE